MRRWIAFSALWTGLFSLSAATQAQPEPLLKLPDAVQKKSDELKPLVPPTTPTDALEKLKKDREELLKEMDRLRKSNSQQESDLSQERAKLRSEIIEAIKRLEQARSTPPTPPVVPKKEDAKSPTEMPKSIGTTGDGSSPLDPLAQAKALYLAGNFDAAIKAFKLIDPRQLDSQEQAFVKYMIASSQRRLGNLTEALNLYREVAAREETDFLKECALWQVSNIRWRQELETQLEDIRNRLNSR